MNHFTASGFWRRYDELPPEIRALEDKQYEFLKANPSHPSLQFKRIKRFWSVRVTRDYRALAVESGSDLV